MGRWEARTPGDLIGALPRPLSASELVARVTVLGWGMAQKEGRVEGGDRTGDSGRSCSSGHWRTEILMKRVGVALRCTEELRSCPCGDI